MALGKRQAAITAIKGHACLYRQPESKAGEGMSGGQFGNKRKDLTFYGHTVSAVPESFKQIASNPGWIDEDTVKLRKMWAEDVPTADIAAEFGLSVSAITCRAKKLGLPRRKRGPGNRSAVKGYDWKQANPRFNTLWHDHAIKLAKRGMKIKDIAAECQRPYTTVHQMLRKKGISAADIRASLKSKHQEPSL